MAMERSLDNILNTNSKVKIIRLFTSRREDFLASGRGIARLTGITPPAAHAALKDLYNQDILKRDIIGKEHIYRLNANNRTVNDILKPAFKKEYSIKEDVFKFLRGKIKEKRIEGKIVSLILYGSLQSGSTDEKSDVDIAIVTGDGRAKKQIEGIFIEDISRQFYEYFGANLDSYIKTKDEFIKRLRKNQPPVSAMMRSYSVIFGKDPLDLK
ncbi:MAG: nucleotidyltransferase domain-containing protein [Candidatus Omnitrophica bacterium]|nr:nucleotidyltransferase domain-containing protein [Candidatus Omnitrophota bacterium]